MDAAAYLQLESALMLRLRKTWAPLAATIYAEMADAVGKGDFAAARALVPEIDLKPVAAKHAEYLRYTLWAYAILGAQQAGGKTPLIASMSFDSLFTHVTAMLVQSLALNSTERVRDFALQSIAAAEAEYQKTQKADKPRYLKDFVSFAGEGDETMRMVSALHSTRLAVWGFCAEAELLDITTYRMSAIIDKRTSEFCRMINGHTFQVAEARSKINTVLQAQDPEDLKTLQPWPKQDKESIAAYKEMTAQELVGLGLHIPPFHPYCRTLLVPASRQVADVTDAPAPQPTVTEPAAPPAPVTPSTVEDFASVGVKVTEDQAAFWSTHVPISPAEALAKVSGVEVKDILDGYLGAKTKTVPVKVKSTGDIVLSTITEGQGGTIVNSSCVLDPFTGDLFLSFAEMKAKDPLKALKLFTQVQANMMNAASAMGAETFTVQAAGGLGLYTYAKLGYLPSAEDWIKLREDLLVEVTGTDSAFHALTAEQYQVLMDLLSSNDPAVVGVLAQLPFRLGTQLVGRVLLADNEVLMSKKVENA